MISGFITPSLPQCATLNRGNSVGSRRSFSWQSSPPNIVKETKASGKLVEEHVESSKLEMSAALVEAFEERQALLQKYVVPEGEAGRAESRVPELSFAVRLPISQSETRAGATLNTCSLDNHSQRRLRGDEVVGMAASPLTLPQLPDTPSIPADRKLFLKYLCSKAAEASSIKQSTYVKGVLSVDSTFISPAPHGPPYPVLNRWLVSQSLHWLQGRCRNSSIGASSSGASRSCVARASGHSGETSSAQVRTDVQDPPEIPETGENYANSTSSNGHSNGNTRAGSSPPDSLARERMEKVLEVPLVVPPARVPVRIDTESDEEVPVLDTDDEGGLGTQSPFLSDGASREESSNLQWEIDSVDSVSVGAREMRFASLYTLELDVNASGLLDEALGAVSFVDGTTSLIVPTIGPVVVGAQKYKGCDVVIDEPRISGKHAFFEMRFFEGHKELTVADMGSTNGVFVNGSRISPWRSVGLKVGDQVRLGAQNVAQFTVCTIKRELLREASTIAALIDDLKANGYSMSDRAWRINKRKRLALGCVLHPHSQLTQEALRNSGVPPVSEKLPRNSLQDVAEAAIPLSAWTTANRDRFLIASLGKGRIREMQEFLFQMAVNYPTDARVWVSLAEMSLVFHRDYSTARVACRAALEACNIAQKQLQMIISKGYGHHDKLQRIELIRLHALTTAAIVEWRAKLYTPARRLFDAAGHQAPGLGVLATQFVFWTWADCELQQGNAAMSIEVLRRAMKSCKTGSLTLLLAKAELMAGKKSRGKHRLAQLSSRFPDSVPVVLAHSNACIDTHSPHVGLSLLQQYRASHGDELGSSVHALLCTFEARAHAAMGNTDLALYSIKQAAEASRMGRCMQTGTLVLDWNPWLELGDFRAARREPYLAVMSGIRASQYTWLMVDAEVAQSRLVMVKALLTTDARSAYNVASELVKSGKLQLQAHCAAAEAALEFDTSSSRLHLASGLRMDPRNLQLLRILSQWLEQNGDLQQSSVVSLYVDEVQRRGQGKVASSVQANAFEIVDDFLWSS